MLTFRVITNSILPHQEKTETEMIAKLNSKFEQHLNWRVLC